MRRLTLALISAAAAFAQPQPEACRLVPETPFQPAARIEEGERALESQTFQASFGLYVTAPDGAPHFVDSVNRIRRIGSGGRVNTLVGNGTRADLLEPGPAREKAMPAVSQLLFSPAGVLHFVSVGRVWKLEQDAIAPVAGSGRPGFNGESGAPTDVSLGTIVNAAFTRSGDLLIVDGYARVRRVAAAVLETVAGSVRASIAAGLVGDGGPAIEAALSNPRQVFPFADGSFWIRDLAGRQLRIVTPGGIIRTVNNNFDTSINLTPLADGSPAATTANRVYPVRINGTIETGAAPYTPFTGAPVAIDAEGALHYVGGERPELRNPLIRLRRGGGQTPVASAPTVALVDGQAPPFGIWSPRTNSLIYAAAVGGKTGIVESRAGQSARFVVGGGADIGDPEGKDAASIAIFGVASFTMDGAGRIIVTDVSRQRILVVGTDNGVSVLSSGGEPVRFAPLTAFNTLQRIAADHEGNIYWYERGVSPTLGVATSEIAAWRRADSSIRTFTVPGLAALVRLDDGGAAVIAGNATNFRSVTRISPAGLGALVEPYRFLPLTSIARRHDRPYFTAATRLFRGAPGAIEMLDLQYLPTGAAFNPSFVMAAGNQGLMVRLGDSGFYRLADPDACRWIGQPRIEAVSSAAGFEYPGTISPFQWITVSGSGFGPPEGQGIVLNGLARAGSQLAPYPAVTLGSFTGAAPNMTLTGTALPVIFSNDRQTTVQTMANLPLASYLLYFTWQGLQLTYPTSLRPVTAAPSLFVNSGGGDGVAAALNEDGSLHGPENAAARGSRVRLLATGLGTHTSTINTGDFYPAASSVNVAGTVRAQVGDQPADVVSATGIPGALGGAYQVDISIPDTLPSGEHAVRITVNDRPPAEEQRQRAVLFVK